MFNDKRASLITAKYNGRTFNNKPVRKGDVVIFFPRGIYCGIDASTSEPIFRNTYLHPADIKKYPKLRNLHKRLNAIEGHDISKISTPTHC